MSDQEHMEHEELMNRPRGKDVSVQLIAADFHTTTVLNSLVVPSSRVVYVRGINYVDLMGIQDDVVRLAIDRGHGNEQNIYFYMPPGPITQMAEIDCFRPPKKALHKVEILAGGTTTVYNWRSLISAFEADQ